MANRDTQLEHTKLLTTDAETKAYLHPTRMNILAQLKVSPATVSAVARQLGVHPANLTHHFRILEAAGLIVLTETRSIGRNIEKLYRAIANRFQVRPPPGAVVNANHTVLSYLRDDLDVGIANLDGSDTEFVFGFLSNARLKRSRAKEFAKRVRQLLAEFTALDDEGGQPLALSLSLYPSTRPFRPRDEDDLVEITKRRTKSNRRQK